MSRLWTRSGSVLGKIFSWNWYILSIEIPQRSHLTNLLWSLWSDIQTLGNNMHVTFVIRHLDSGNLWSEMPEIKKTRTSDCELCGNDFWIFFLSSTTLDLTMNTEKTQKSWIWIVAIKMNWRKTFEESHSSNATFVTKHS